MKIVIAIACLGLLLASCGDKRPAAATPRERPGQLSRTPKIQEQRHIGVVHSSFGRKFFNTDQGCPCRKILTK